MQDEEFSELIESVSEKLACRSRIDLARIDGWLDTLDALGFAWAIKAQPELDVFRMNEIAQRDLKQFGKSSEVIIPDGRGILISDESLYVWAPLARAPKIDCSVLSMRELEVWEWMQQGKTLQETATILGISARTVEKHRQNLREKLSL